jgi:hypothetical protein
MITRTIVHPREFLIIKHQNICIGIISTPTIKPRLALYYELEK